MSSNNAQETNVSVQPKSSNVSLSSVIPSSLVPTVIPTSLRELPNTAKPTPTLRVNKAPKSSGTRNNNRVGSSSPPSSPVSSNNPSVKPSVDNHTSAWEPYIRRYRAGSFTTVSKLLFVVNFHHLEYSAVPFLNDTFFPEYRRMFPIDFDLVMLGPRWDNNYKVINCGTPRLGFYSYHSLWLAYHQLCVVESCSYDGFVYMNDDSYVDPQFLITYDLTQSWVEPSIKMNTRERWIWFNKKNKRGVRYLDAFRRAIKKLKNTEVGKTCHFEDATNLRKGFADFYYLTKNDMPKYYALIPEMKRQLVFLELAAPTVNWCITHNFVINCNHGKMKNKLKCVHVHPVKLRIPKMRTYAMQRLHHLNMYETPIRGWYAVCLTNSFS